MKAFIGLFLNKDTFYIQIMKNWVKDEYLCITGMCQVLSFNYISKINVLYLNLYLLLLLMCDIIEYNVSLVLVPSSQKQI